MTSVTLAMCRAFHEKGMEPLLVITHNSDDGRKHVYVLLYAGIADNLRHCLFGYHRVGGDWDWFDTYHGTLQECLDALTEWFEDIYPQELTDDD